MTHRPSTRRDLLALTALCAVVYATGLTTHGVTNWQEAQRLVVAREMQARGEWIVPTINGRPYLAKPLMIYWAQMGIANLRGGTVGLFDLRLAVALAGWAGVIATYLVTRRLLQRTETDAKPAGAPDAWARDAAWWSALCLATGILYVRSSRIGELDILLVPFVVVAVGAIAAAWRLHRTEARTGYTAVTLATLAAAGAALTKGPPGVVVIAAAGYGGIALWEACRDRDSSTVAGGGVPDAPRRLGVPALIGLCAGAVTAGVLAWPNVQGPSDAPGRLALAGIGACAGAILGRLAEPRRAVACLTAFSRTHPVAVLGLPLLAVWGWGRLVSARIGSDETLGLAAEEAEDNLRPFIPESPLNNLEALAYGAGLGSAAAIIAVIWLLKDRPRPHPSWFIVLAWVGLGFAAFSVFGKGVPRYLTPVWPGVAILGGLWIASFLRDVRRPGRARTVLGAAVLALALGQAWWYAIGRERFHGERSPRAIVTELLGPGFDVDPANLATFEFRTPAIDYYAGRTVPPVGQIRQRTGMAGVEPWTLDDLRDEAARRGDLVLLIRANPADGSDPRPAPDRLAEAGFIVQTLPTSARFVIDAGRTEVRAVRIAVR